MRRGTEFPWLADLLITLTGFTDILGNRLDLYDHVVWFDDWMHLMNVAFLSAAVLLLTTSADTPPTAVLERSLAFGTTAALVWELYEFTTFVTRSPERTTASISWASSASDEPRTRLSRTVPLNTSASCATKRTIHPRRLTSPRERPMHCGCGARPAIRAARGWEHTCSIVA